jgi:hypothetical protein
MRHHYGAHPPILEIKNPRSPSHHWGSHQISNCGWTEIDADGREKRPQKEEISASIRVHPRFPPIFMPRGNRTGMEICQKYLCASEPPRCKFYQNPNKKPPMSIAFKEWAIICETLGSGGQSIILRKGGIHEGRDGFSFKHPHFFLFPTLVHEQIARPSLPPSTPIPAPPPGQIPIAHFARVEWTATITSLDTALALHPFHVWNQDIVRERFLYDEAPGLHLAFLRLFRCDPPWSFPDDPKYGGCRSWVTIPDPSDALKLIPALSSEEHQHRSAALKALLGNN